MQTNTPFTPNPTAETNAPKVDAGTPTGGNAPKATPSAASAAVPTSAKTPRFDLAGRVLNDNGTVQAGQQPKAFNGFDELLKSTFGGGGAMGESGGADATRQQMDGQMTDALSVARRIVSRRLSGIARPQFDEAQKRFDERFGGGGAGIVGSGTTRSAAPVMGRAATDAGVTLAETNGKPSASYEYGGTRVAIPDGMDLNDDEAMSNFISSNNEVIDWMNSGSDEEEDM